MRRSLPLLLLLVLPALAGTREDYVAARDKLKTAHFDQLDADERDRLFEALGGYDHQEVVAALAEIGSFFGTYMAGVEGQLTTQQEKLQKVSGRVGMSDIEVGLRNSYIRKIDKLEKEWRRARVSEDLLVSLIGAYREPKTIQQCMTKLQKHPTWRVRQLLARAAAHWHVGIKDPNLSKRLMSALRSMGRDKEAGVRIAVARAVAAFKRQDAINIMQTCLKDADWRVRGAAIKGLAEAGTDAAIGMLIRAMGREKGRLKDDINKILVEKSGENFGYADSWMRWWKSNGEQLPPKKEPKIDEETGLPVESGNSKRKRDDVRFYGIRTQSERICFIIDVSGSMKKEVPPIVRVVITGRKEQRVPADGKTRIEVARNELKRAVSNLNKDKEFLIIFFNHAVRKWRPEMVEATPKVKQAVRTDLDLVRASGATYTLGALREAFTIAGVINRKGVTPKDGAGIDTIFLLSDGGPTNNKLEEPKRMDPDPILDQVKEWNRDAGIVIHTIAVDPDEAGDYFLRQLAAQNGGVFVERK